MRDIFSIIVMVMEIIVSAIGIVEFLVKRNTKKLVEAIIVILVIAGVAIVFLKYESRINGIIEKYLKTQENDITEETTENDEKFNPDYEPGKENIIENSKYINNNGMIAVQDKKIYIATYDKIVKMNIDYTELEDVIDVMASNLNVLGDWIYYCQDDGIYKVRTDGKYNERLIELSTYAYEMIVRDNGIYFINREDMKLYFMCNDGTKLRLISDDTMITFSFINYGSTLVYTKIDMEYNEDGKLSGYRPMAVYAVNGDNKMLVLEYEMGDYGAVEDPPMDICDYKENFVYCNYFGLFIRDALTFDVKKLTDNSEIDKYVCEFEKTNLQQNLRGKYELEFFRKIIDDLKNKNKRGEYFSEKRDCIKIDPNVDPLLILSQFADTPPSLIAFLRQYSMKNVI